jgi:exodeoxyribonuclease V alpha subunit
MNIHPTSDVHEQFAMAFEEERIRPIAYLLSRRLLEGNICVPLSELTDPGNESPYAMKDLQDLTMLPRLISSDPDANVPFIQLHNKIYLQRYFRYESKIINIIHRLVEKSRQMQQQRMQEMEEKRDIITTLLADYATDKLSEAERVDWQLAAALNASLQSFSIITGGPGTGKTTTLSKLLRILYAQQPIVRVALTAPTGKASMRMAESLRRTTASFPADIRERIEALKPTTIHGLLGYIRNSIYYKHNTKNPLPFDLVIVDEASMIDIPMFAKLLDALGENGRIILLGDKDQLASVEAGSLLGDLCSTVPELNSLPEVKANWINNFVNDNERKISLSFIKDNDSLLAEHIIELKLSHRFKQQGAIGSLSRAVINSDHDSINDLMKAIDPNMKFDTAYDPKTLEEFVAGYEAYIKETDIARALGKLNEVRVLVTVREGERGLYAVNRKIEAILRERKLIRPDKEFYENRPVIITRNNYELDLFNGDLGIVRTDGEGNLRVWFEGSDGAIRSVLPTYLNNCETVFAMTIHKSQGSEFNNVMVILPEGIENPLLTRELLYTAITRAKERVVVQGAYETILHASSKSVKRISGICDRIQLAE